MKNSNLKPNTVSRISFKSIEQIAKSSPRLISTAVAFLLVLLAILCLSLPISKLLGDNRLAESLSIAAPVRANSTYFNFSTGNLTLNITPTTTNLITTNDDWSNIPGVEGYCGNNLTATHGVDPQNVLTSEYAVLPSARNTCVNANKGNPSAFNAGGITEFDRSGAFAIGFQGNVQANPYLVFYLNTVGQNTVGISYDLTDIDDGSNDSVSPIALQYRVGESGAFTNIPAGYVSDVTDGPNISGRKTSKAVTLPAAALNQPKVQLRLMTTNAAGPDGNSTPDEWIGINNIVITNQAPTAASVTVGGRVTTELGKPLRNVQITLQDSTGNFRTAITNPFGYYHFSDLAAGESYFFSARSKRFVFTAPTQFLIPLEDYNGVNFVAGF